jgi:hypothetical protein
MVDLLTTWGVTSAAGLIFKPVLEDLYQELKGLAKDATEDWLKDIFKKRLSAGSSTFLSRIHREPLDIAAGKAIKGFLEIVQDCLDDTGLEEEAIANYTYQETILEKYGNLKLESLDSSGYIYDKELKIYQIFIPQNVKG